MWFKNKQNYFTFISRHKNDVVNTSVLTQNAVDQMLIKVKESVYYDFFKICIKTESLKGLYSNCIWVEGL